MIYATRIEERTKARGEDRGAVVSLVDRSVIAVADGAGGTGGGAAAAQAVCDAVIQTCAVASPANWETWLADLDAQMPHADAEGTDPASQADILFCAIRWCRYWAARGHGLDPWF